MAKRFSSKSTETRDELSTTCNPKVMSRYLSVPDATCEQAAKTDMVSVVRIQVILCTRVWVILVFMTCPHETEKAYTCWIERRWAGYRLLSVQCLNST